MNSIFTSDLAEAAERLTATVPGFQRILTVAEIAERTRALVVESRKRVTVEQIGVSRMGRPIEAITVGSGSMTVLLLGFPHPDEGVGELMIEHLLATIVKFPEIAVPFDARFVVVKCWDIDGAALNEGWRPGEQSFDELARHHYRPPPAMQMEWTFPIEYNSHRWTQVPPETEAVRRLIERERPHLMFGLHNAAFHDPYFYLSREAPETYPLLVQAVETERLKLSDRSPDVPFEVPLAPGIFKMYGLREYYDYYEKFAPERLKHLKRGACSDEYLALNVAGSFSFNAEVPRMIDRRIRDRTPTARPLREVVLARTRQQAQEFKRLDVLLSPLLERHDLSGSLLSQSVGLHLEEFRARGGEGAADVARDPQYERKATVADVLENELIGPFEDMLVVGQGWRVATEFAKGGDAQAKKAAADLGARITGIATVIKGRAKFEPVLLKHAAGIQLRALLILMAWRLKQGV